MLLWNHLVIMKILFSNRFQEAFSGVQTAVSDSKTKRSSESGLWSWNLFRKLAMSCTYVHWRKSGNDREGKAEEKFWCSFPTTFRIGEQCSGSICFWAFWIRIHNLFVRIRILPSISQKIKKTLFSTVLLLLPSSLWLFIFEEWCKCTFNNKKNLKTWKHFFGLPSWRSLTKKAEAGSRAGR